MKKVYKIKVDQDYIHVTEKDVEIIYLPETNREKIEAIFEKHDKRYASAREWRTHIVNDLVELFED